MTASQILNGRQQFIDINGDPLVAGTVGMYVPGTLTPKNTWQDAAQMVLNTNPIILDSRGQATIFGSGTYRQILKDRDGNLIWDVLTYSDGSGGYQPRAFVAPLDSPPIDPYPVLPCVTPEMFEAVGDLLQFTDATVSTSSAHTLTTNSTAIPAFTGTKLAAVYGASSATYALFTTCTWVNAHTLTLTAAVTASISNTHAMIATDDTAAMQQALAAGYKVIAANRYGVTGTLIWGVGQIISGTGWSGVPNDDILVNGSCIGFFSASGKLLDAEGASNADTKTNGILQDIALITFAQSPAPATYGVFLSYARSRIIRNVYATGFGTLFHFQNDSWKGYMENVSGGEFYTGLYLGSGSEDNVFCNVIFAPFNPVGDCFFIDNQAQTLTFIGCQALFSNRGFVFNQGDSNGDGTGVPLPMEAVLINPGFEDLINSSIWVTSSNGSYDNTYHPLIQVIGGRTFCAGTWVVAPNSGQTVIYAAHAGSIKYSGHKANAVSYGLFLNQNFKGYTVTGTSPTGPTLIELDTSSYGTAQVSASAAALKNVHYSPGNSQTATLGSAALTTVGATPSVVPFTNVITDLFGWYSATAKLIPPSGRVSLSSQVYISTATAGRYQLFVYKNASSYVLLDDQTISGSVPIMLKGVVLDTASGTDAYTIVLLSSVNATVDTTQTSFAGQYVGI